MSTQHSISFNQAIAISIGSIIGWGAYVMPGNLFLPKGAFYGSIIALVLGTLCVYLIALSYIYLLQRTPENRSGGVYWVKYYLNERHAFIYGRGVAIGYMSIIALNLSAVVLLLRYLLPDEYRAAVYLYTVSGRDVYLSDVLICAGILLFFGMTNYRGIKWGGQKFNYLLQ